MSLSVLSQQVETGCDRLGRVLSRALSLVGPCALEYTKLKTADHYWTDPSADELVQRHRIHGVHGRQDSPSKRPALGVGIDWVAASALGRVDSENSPRRERLGFRTTFLFSSVMEPLSQIRRPFVPKCPLCMAKSLRSKTKLCGF